jgi:hypothetical protein
MTPLVGHKVWFGPRRLGWGLAPVSPEGRAVTVIAVISAIGTSRRRDGRRSARLIAGALVLAALLKGTAPGGPGARAAFEASQLTDTDSW